MKRRYKLRMIFKILLAHCSSSIVALDCSKPPSPCPKTYFPPIPPFPSANLFSVADEFLSQFCGTRIQFLWRSSSVRRYSEGKQSFCAGGAQNGQGILGRKSHRGKQRHCCGRGQPVFPA